MITRTGGVCGGSAVVAGTRLTVWGLTVYSRVGYTDDTILESSPQLSREDLDEVWDYLQKNPEEIERDIERNAWKNS